jgi:hypothetical protein
MSENRDTDRLIHAAPDINRARHQAAEALFAPKRHVQNPAAGSAQQDQRKPRILSAVREQQPQAAHVEATKAASSARETKATQASTGVRPNSAPHLGEIRDDDPSSSRRVRRQ